MNADSIRIESDEDGFHLIVETDEGEVFDFRIHDIEEEIYDAVKDGIGPYLYEKASARHLHLVTGEPLHAECPQEWTLGEEYPLYDPKHPDFHDNFSALHDNREGK